MRKRPKEKWIDDGRVVAPMDFDAIPGGVLLPGASSARSGSAMSDPLDRKETAQAIGGALLAALLVGFVFIGGIFLFLLFAVNVWFR